MQHTIEVTVKHVDLEGGFYGLEADMGFKYQPVNGLPDEFQVDGKKVKVTIKDADGVSFMQWGKSVKIINIEAA